MTDFSSARRSPSASAWSSVSGEVDLYTAPRFKEDLVALIETGVEHVIVDLSQVTFIDSTALGVIISGVKRMAEREGRLAIVAGSRPVVRILDITGLDKVLTVFDTRDGGARRSGPRSERVAARAGGRPRRPAVAAGRAVRRVSSWRLGAYRRPPTGRRRLSTRRPSTVVQDGYPSVSLPDAATTRMDPPVRLIVTEKDSAAQKIAQILGGNVQVKEHGRGRQRVKSYAFEWQGKPTVSVGLRGHVMETIFPNTYRRWSLKYLDA